MSDEIIFDAAAIAAEYGITTKQAWFAEFYLQTLNQSKAARLAGYATPSVDGTRLLADARVKRYVNQRFTEVRAEASEVIARVTAIARADIADFYDEETGDIDYLAAIKAGKSYPIKKIKSKVTRNLRNDTVTREIEFELHSSLTANDMLGKYHKLWADTERKPEEAPQPEDLSDAELTRIARASIAAGDVSADDAGLGDVPSGAAAELIAEDQAAEDAGVYDDTSTP